MPFRKFTRTLEESLQTELDKILLVNGAGLKSYLISYVSKKFFKNYVEINLKEDKEDDGILKQAIRTELDATYVLLCSWNPYGDGMTQ